MADPNAADVVWLDVLPSMRGFGPAVGKGARKPADEEGKKFGRRFGQAMLVGVAAVGAGAALVSKSLYGIGETFDELTDTIAVGTGASGKDLDALVASAKNVGTQVPAEFDAIGEAVSTLNTLTGATGESLEGMTASVLDASRMLGEDGVTNAEAFGKAMAQWQIPVEEGPGKVDALYVATQKYGVGLGEITGHLNTYGSVLKNADFSMEESAALFGELESSGISVSRVMPGLNKSFRDWASEGKNSKEELAAVVEQMKDAETGSEALSIATEVFGAEGAQRMTTAVRNGSIELDSLTQSLADSDGAIAESAKQTNDFKEQWKLFKNDIMVMVAPAAEWLFSKIADGMTWIKDVAVPAIKDFASDWMNFDGTAGQVRTTVEQVWGWLKSMFDLVRNNLPVVASLTAGVLAYHAANKTLAMYKALHTFLTTTTLKQRALNLAMKANPIGIVITAITALVAALVWLYNNNETARRIINGAWQKIKGAISGVVSWFKDTAWPWMRDAMAWIGDKANWLWKNVIVPAWGGISGAVRTSVDWIRNTAWPWLRDAFQSVGDKANWLWKEIIVPAWEGITGAISGAWDGAKEIFRKFKGGLDDLRDKFSSIKRGIGSIWGGIISVIGKPVNIVLGFINDSLISGMNWLFDKIPGVDLSIPDIPLISIPSPPAVGGRGGGGGGASPVFLAEGGTVPGWSPSPTADNILARLTAGEFVLPVKATAQLLKQVGAGGLESLRRGRLPLPGFAKGGPVGGGLGDLWNGLKGIASGVVQLLRDPIGFIKDKITGWLGGIGDSWPAQVFMGTASTIASGLGNWAKEKIFGGNESSAPVAGGMHWSNIWAIISGLIPGARMTSNYRPGARTASGYTSYHGLSRAVDFVSGNMGAAWQTLRMMGIPWTELYYSPMGFIRRGRLVPRSAVSPVTIANHYDHVHAAYAQGGLVKRPLLFDSGGYLPVGDSMVRNNTGRPEPLMRLNGDGAIGLSKEDRALFLAAIERPVVLNVDSREVATANRNGNQAIGAPGRWADAPRLGRRP